MQAALIVFASPSVSDCQVMLPGELLPTRDHDTLLRVCLRVWEQAPALRAELPRAQYVMVPAKAANAWVCLPLDETEVLRRCWRERIKLAE